MSRDDAVTHAQAGLAALLANRRTNGQVYMGGEHNPTPGEIRAAEMYVRDLLDAGWTPPPAAQQEETVTEDCPRCRHWTPAQRRWHHCIGCDGTGQVPAQREQLSDD